MFEVGDVVIYSEHGLCKIDDICERDLFGETRLYYVLHPLAETTLKISTPVDGKKKKIQRTMDRKEAEKLLGVFGSPGIEWVDDPKQRARAYQSLVQSGDRKRIAEVANALMDKKLNTSRASGVSSIRTMVELGEGLRQPIPEFDVDNNFALCGGCVPVRTPQGRLLGYAQSSGMRHEQDHQLIIDALSEYLGIEVPSLLK